MPRLLLLDVQGWYPLVVAAWKNSEKGWATSAVTTGSANYPQWGLSFSYGRYGNRTQQSVTAGSGVPSNCVGVNAATNQLTGPCGGGNFSYDANGNMTNDAPFASRMHLRGGNNTLTYDALCASRMQLRDAENRVVSASNGGSSGTYTFDGNSLRVKKVSGSTTTVYIFSGSKVVAEYDNGAAPGSPSREYIYGSSGLLARIDSSGTNYYHQDLLSNRLLTDSSGNIVAQLGHYPFGESWYNASNNKLLFTSYERDAESSNDYAVARSYVNRLGRFSSPDPADLLSASLDSPQTLNKYSYVANMPLSYFDPTGLGSCTAAERMDGDCGHQVNDAVGSGCESWDPSCATTCIINGFASSCGWTQSLLAQGLAGICPNDDCFNQTFTTNNNGVSGFIPTFASVYLASMSNSGGCIGLTCVLQASFFTPVAPWSGMAVLADISNFSAGAGDCLTGRCLPFVNTSVTEWVRGLNGADSVVNKNGAAYFGGEVTGGVVASELAAAIGVTAAAVADGKYGAWFGRGGKLAGGFFNRGWIRFGWYWNGLRDAIGLRIGPAGVFHLPFWYP